MATAGKATATSDGNVDLWSDGPWSEMKRAIMERWPHIGEKELTSLKCCREHIVKFLTEFTEASKSEIESVVDKFTGPQGAFQQMTKAVEAVSDRVVSPIQSVVERARYEVDEHRSAATALVFVAGIVVGVWTTLALRKPAPVANRFSNYFPHGWKN